MGLCKETIFDGMKCKEKCYLYNAKCRVQPGNINYANNEEKQIIFSDLIVS